jgi:2-methylfumaryl-CoA hydratase
MHTARPAGGYFFEDYAVGQQFVHATPRTITQGDVALYQALTGSRNPLHCSEPFAQSLGYPSMPVDDLLVFHVAFGKTVPDISYNAVANLGYAECRFLQPVFIGDTLTARTDVLGTKPNSSGKTGVVYVRSNAINQRGETVLTWVRWVMVHRKNAPAPNESPAAAGITHFAETVAEADTVLPTFAKRPGIASLREATGSDVFWDEIETGTTIIHPSGITIDESDHTLATKLYQNTARVHFDLHHMQDSRFGRRLVYGGHVISLARALAHDGLANALMIAAINGGTHHHPTFAGDTIYATSTSLSKWSIGAGFGAVRVSLAAYKNVDPNKIEFQSARDDARVLTLDYTVVMPRRH